MTKNTQTDTGIENSFNEPKKRSWLRGIFRELLREKPLGTAGGIILLIMLLVGIFADVLAPYGYREINLGDKLLGPGVEKYILGTDNLGRDQLSRIIYGARVSVIVGLSAATLHVIVAIWIGLSGFIGGKTDLIVQRFVDGIMCFPWLFLVLTIMAILGQGMTQVILVLGITAGIRNSRVVRSAIMAIKENQYIQAAESIGSTRTYTVFRHILPNIMAPIIIIFTLNMGQSILAEATMSFLGFGIPPPTPSWGQMLSLEGRRYMVINPWLSVWPGLSLCIGVYGINMLGDALRDILDPRMKGRVGRYGQVKKKNFTDV